MENPTGRNAHEPALIRLLLGACEVQGCVRFVADHPTVVAGGHVKQISWRENDFRAVVHLDHRIAGEHQADVFDVAAFLAEGLADRTPTTRSRVRRSRGRPLQQMFVGLNGSGSRPRVLAAVPLTA